MSDSECSVFMMGRFWRGSRGPPEFPYCCSRDQDMFADLASPSLWYDQQAFAVVAQSLVLRHARLQVLGYEYHRLSRNLAIQKREGSWRINWRDEMVKFLLSLSLLVVDWGVRGKLLDSNIIEAPSFWRCDLTRTPVFLDNKGGQHPTTDCNIYK